MSFELIIFDKDGVLLNLSKTWIAATIAMARYTESLIDGRVGYKKLLEAIGVELDESGEDGLITDNSPYASGTYSSLLPIWGALDHDLKNIIPSPEYTDNIFHILVDEVRGKTAPKGHPHQVMRSLAEEGYRLATLTNDGDETTKINLDDLGISAFMDMVITADSGVGRKPEGGGFRHICDCLEIHPEKTLMIGDTYADHDAAIEAGCGNIIAVTDGAPTIPEFMPKATHAIPSIDYLPALLKSLK